tara:strand:+ start:3964 stop:4239 length:276 start_codon:yes stop_codon:yes gene_type:complete
MKTYSPKIIAPVVHSNGSSKRSLQDEWLDAVDAIDNLIDNLPYDSFHGRNQYPKIEVDQQITREYRGQLLFELAEIKRVFNGVLGEINKQG